MVGRRAAREPGDVRPLEQAARLDQRPGGEHPLRPERVLGSVVVAARLGTQDETGGAAHAVRRVAIAAAVRSTIELALVVGDHERRSEHHQIAVAVDVTRARVQEQPRVPGRREDAFGRLELAGERRPARPVRHELDAHHQPDPSNIPDRGIVLERRRERLHEELPLARARLDEVVLGQSAQRGVGDRGADAVVRPREPVDEPGLAHRLEHHTRTRREPEGEVPARRTLPHRHHVGPDAPVVDAEPSPGATEPGHDLVGDQENAVAPADLGDGRPVVVGRDGGGQRRTGDRLGDERGDRGRAGVGDRPVQALGVPRAAGDGVVGVRTPVLVRGVHVVEPPEPRLVRTPQRLLPADVERPQRVPVVRGLPADHPGPRRLAPGEMEGAGELDRGLDRLAPTRDRVDPGVVQGQQGRDRVGVRLERLGREHRPVDVGGPRRLFGHRVHQRTVAVADVHDDRAARSVQVAPAFGVLDPHTLGADGSWQRSRQDAMEDVAHAGGPIARRCTCPVGRAASGSAAARPRSGAGSGPRNRRRAAPTPCSRGRRRP